MALFGDYHLATLNTNRLIPSLETHCQRLIAKTISSIGVSYELDIICFKHIELFDGLCEIL